MQNPIAVEGLSVQYGHTPALREITFAVPEGAVCAMLGANGAGKSTTLRVLAGLEPRYRGSARLLGAEARTLSAREYVETGYVSEAQDLPDRMTIGEMMAFWRPFYPRWDRALEAGLLRRFALPTDRRIGALSHGMRMKTALTAALAYRPKAVILDEPLTGLDPLMRDDLMAALAERPPGTTVLLSSHELAEVELLATHIVYLEQGRVRYSGTLAALAGRFRQVTVEGSPPLPDPWPPSWWEPAPHAGGLRFLDSAYIPERSETEIAARFPGSPGVEIQPVPLRTIFLAMARQAVAP